MIRGLSLASGVGGLDLGIKLALGGAYQTLAYCEIDPFCQDILLARMADGLLDRAAVFGDLRSFDARGFRGAVDLVHAGLPCQPYSVAGKRRGHDDPRGWNIVEHAVRIVGECRPAMVFFENVPAWVTGGWFRRCGEALSGLGYCLESPFFCRASDVGAPHRRERVFILAHRDGHEPVTDGIGAGHGWTDWRDDVARRGRGPVADAEQSHLHPSPPGRADGAGGGTTAGTGRELLDDPTGSRQGGRLAGSSAPARDEARGRESGGRRDGVAYPASGSGQDGAPERAGAGRPASAGDALGDADEPPEDAHSSAGRSRRTVGQSGESVADPAEPRLEGRFLHRLPGDAAGHAPAWPPGPAERDRWAAILARWPELAPAVANARHIGRSPWGQDEPSRADDQALEAGSPSLGSGSGATLGDTKRRGRDRRASSQRGQRPTRGQSDTESQSARDGLPVASEPALRVLADGVSVVLVGTPCPDELGRWHVGEACCDERGLQDCAVEVLWQRRHSSRANRLRALGNACVPAQAAYAFVTLATDLMGEEQP